jgi:hypothetical protein
MKENIKVSSEHVKIFYLNGNNKNKRNIAIIMRLYKILKDCPNSYQQGKGTVGVTSNL